MTFEKPKEFKGKIIQIIDRANYLVYVEELDSNIQTTISGKLSLLLHSYLYVGNELIIQVSSIDKTKGRFFRGSLNLIGK